MKKIIKTLLVVMVVVLALTAFVACQQEEPAPEIPACEHTGGTATCSKQAICELCGELYGEKAAHTPVEIPEVKPTGMNIGFTSGTKCEACGLVLEAQQKVEKSGHNMVDVEAKAPTCGEEGYVAHKKCSACGIVDESYATVEPTGEHTFTIDVEAKTPTCLEDGYTAHKTCELCGNPNEDYVLYTAGDDYHSFPEEDQFFVTPPTCTTTGVLAGYCEYCGTGYYLDKNYPALGHKDEDANGVCDVCEENMPAEEPECEHVWNEGEVTTAPTCEAAGVKTYTCTVEGCGETKTEEVAALGHTWADATCTAPKACETCGATEGEALGHSYVDSVCTVCGYVMPDLVNAVLDCTTKNNRVSFSTDKQVWSQNGITLTLEKGEGTTYSDKAPITFSSKGSLTIEGKGIKVIVIETGNTTYGTYVSNCFKDQPGVQSVKAESGRVTVVLSEAVNSFTIESLAKQGQIKTITVNPEG